MNINSNYSYATNSTNAQKTAEMRPKPEAKMEASSQSQGGANATGQSQVQAKPKMEAGGKDSMNFNQKGGNDMSKMSTYKAKLEPLELSNDNENTLADLLEGVENSTYDSSQYSSAMKQLLS